MSQHGQITALADRMAAELGEHCDSVRIFCTVHGEDSNTTSYSVGYGNFYAQIGLVQEWMTRQDEFVRENTRKGDDSDL